METQQAPQMLPGSDALRVNKFMLVIYLVITAVALALGMLLAFDEIPAHGGQLGHLPWPIVQWALMTPLGVLTVYLVGGLVVGIPLGLAGRAGWLSSQAVDVTDLPPADWPAPPPPPWRQPGGPTQAEYWLGRGWRQRALSLFVLVLAVLLMLGLCATFVEIGSYASQFSSACTGSHCPPAVGYLHSSPPGWIALSMMFLTQYRWIRRVERRCGIWFRIPDRTRSGLTWYVRRPGVTAEDAATALARYRPREARQPAGQHVLGVPLLFVPFFLVLIAPALLAAWLPTQWIP